MNKKVALLALTFLQCIIIQTTEIKHIFIDPNVIFTTNQSKAAGYIGKWEAIKYTGATGHLPSQKHFFADLKNVPATSTVRTYDEGLEAPFIISDWLLGTPTEELAAAIQNFLAKSSLSQTEKNIHTNTSNMMFDSNSLAKVQKVRRKIEKLLKLLKTKKYKLYFVGNWTEIDPLKKMFPQIFKYIDEIYISSQMKQIKPQKEFWKTVWISNHLNPEECLCIEAEPKFYEVASQLDCKVALYHHKKIKQFCAELQSHGVDISL